MVNCGSLMARLTLVLPLEASVAAGQEATIHDAPPSEHPKNTSALCLGRIASDPST
jgi:hypothetical protein